MSGIKQCYNCKATTTPLWRRDPGTHRTLCNACGLYVQQRRFQRPKELIYTNNTPVCVPDGPECNHCGTRQTTVWRRNKQGDKVCNACGVFEHHHGIPRPLSLKGKQIKPRPNHHQP
ncbi:hypothetical protein DFH07DRAFT_744580 [Mycena maculata]|uniref:GATA-type domain-containing protein n=1 Tax=Mycena maculata TaxID=230809 RepID=A0AAD7J2J6_9AGAR|nr:hypothetical protein DFH07DRAFT_744580 [Mycena maculata]